MRWRVETTELSGNRRLLEDVLRELSISIVEDEGKLFLVSERFEACDTPSEVHSYVSRVRSIVEEVRRHNPDISCSFSVGSVLEQGAGGVQRHHFLVGASARHLHSAGHVAAIRVDRAKNVSEDELQRQEVELQERQYQGLLSKAVARIVSAVNDDRALTVQQLLQKPQTPLVLGHIMELIQDDLGGRLRELVSEKQLSRFDRSISHPDVFGQNARHIVSRHEPPPMPMYLDEARALVHETVEKWLSMKARIGGGA